MKVVCYDDDDDDCDGDNGGEPSVCEKFDEGCSLI